MTFIQTYDDLDLFVNKIQVKSKLVPSFNYSLDGCPYALEKQQWIRSQSSDWQHTDATNDTFVVSAYIDTRNPAINSVVIIGIARNYASRSRNAREHYCYVYMKEEGPPIIYPAIFKFVPETLDREYAISFHECVLSGLGKYRPFGVSLTLKLCQKPLNQFIFERQTSSFLFNFTVCYGPLHTNYSNYKRLVETTELNRMFGAQYFYFYDQHSSPSITTYVDEYINEGLATRIIWKPPVEKSKIWLFAQVGAINDCFYRNLYRSRFILFVDLDEVIVPRRDTTWLHMMARISNSSKLFFPGVYSVQNTFFMRSAPNDSSWSSYCPSNIDKTACIATINGMQIHSLQSLLRDSRIYPWDKRSKIIIWTKAVKMLGIHMIYESIERSKVKIVKVNASDALLHHYRDEPIDVKGTVADHFLAKTRWIEIYDRVRAKYNGKPN